MKFLTLQINFSVCSIYTSFFLFNVTFFPPFISFSFLSSVHYISQARSYFVLAQCWQPFTLPFFVRSQENQPKQKGACKIWGSHNAADEVSGLLVCHTVSLHVVPKISRERGAFSEESRRLFLRNFKNHSPMTVHHIPPEFSRAHFLWPPTNANFYYFYSVTWLKDIPYPHI